MNKLIKFLVPAIAAMALSTAASAIGISVELTNVLVTADGGTGASVFTTIDASTAGLGDLTLDGSGEILSGSIAGVGFALEIELGSAGSGFGTFIETVGLDISNIGSVAGSLMADTFTASVSCGGGLGDALICAPGGPIANTMNTVGVFPAVDDGTGLPETATWTNLGGTSIGQVLGTIVTFGSTTGTDGFTTNTTLTYTATITSVPEPGTLLLLGSGLLGLGVFARRS